MVCVPCFIIPVLLFVWHRFIQPYVLRIWNPWAKKDKDGNIIPHDKTEFPIDCSGGKCTFLAKGKPKAVNNTELATADASIQQTVAKNEETTNVSNKKQD